MRYLPLVWGAWWRNRTESLLTLLALTAGFTLLGAMLALNAAYAKALQDVRKDAAFMFCRFNCADGLPLGYRSKVAALGGVVATGPMFAVALGLGWSTAVAVLGGIFPALRASRIPAAEALRAA